MYTRHLSPGQIFVATFCGRTLHTHSLVLTKGQRTRAEEDAVASTLVLQALATVCDMTCNVMADVLLPGEAVEVCGVLLTKGGGGMVLGNMAHTRSSLCHWQQCFPGHHKHVHHSRKKPS